MLLKRADIYIFFIIIYNIIHTGYMYNNDNKNNNIDCYTTNNMMMN